MKKYLLIIFMFCASALQAQDMPVKPGDHVPDITISNIINGPAKTVKISQFKGKLLILDFWATNCGSCVRAIPRFDSLQSQFKDRLQILPISYEKQAIVEAFLNRNPVGRNMRLPIATDDSRLKRLFPHLFLSHEVWINEKGMVIAITAPEYVNATNIQALLDHRPVDLPLKADVFDYDYNRPLVNDSRSMTYSGIDHYKPGVMPRFGMTKDSLNHRLRFYIINSSVVSLYMITFDPSQYLPKTCLQIHIKDTSRLHMPGGIKREPWKQKNEFCYETVQPLDMPIAQVKENIRLDLNRYFKLDGRMENKKAKCLVLERFSQNDHLLADSNSHPINTLHSKDSIKVLSNCNLSDIIWELNDIPAGLPAIDHTGITGKVNMRLAIPSFSDIASVNKALAPYGLVVKEEMQEVEFFVLTDAKQTTLSDPN